MALCRYYGRKILWLLMSHQEFDRMLTKYLPANTLRNIQDVVENLKSKVRLQELGGGNFTLNVSVLHGAHSSQHIASKSWRHWL